MPTGPSVCPSETGLAEGVDLNIDFTISFPVLLELCFCQKPLYIFPGPLIFSTRCQENERIMQLFSSLYNITINNGKCEENEIFMLLDPSL